MLHVYIQIFDVTGTVEFFLGTKHGPALWLCIVSIQIIIHFNFLNM